MSFRFWKELQHRRSDHTECAFSPDEQVFEIVTRIIFAQSLEAIPHAAISQHHFEAQAQFARVTIGEHIEAACVGGKITTDPT